MSSTSVPWPGRRGPRTVTPLSARYSPIRRMLDVVPVKPWMRRQPVLPPSKKNGLPSSMTSSPAGIFSVIAHLSLTGVSGMFGPSTSLAARGCRSVIRVAEDVHAIYTGEAQALLVDHAELSPVGKESLELSLIHISEPTRLGMI